MSHWAKTGYLLPNVYDYGARPGVDATASIQAAIDDAIASGAGGIFLPPGEWLLSRNGAMDYCLRVNAGVDFAVYGAGWVTQLKLADGSLGTNDLSMVRITGGSSRVFFQDIAVNGNKANITNIAEFAVFEIDDAIDVTLDSIFIYEVPASASVNGAFLVGPRTGTDAVSRVSLLNINVLNSDGTCVRAGDVDDFLVVDNGILDGVEGVVIDTRVVGTTPQDYQFADLTISATDYAIRATKTGGAPAANRIGLSGIIVPTGRVVIGEIDDVQIADSFFSGQVSGDCVVLQDTAGNVRIAGSQFTRGDALRIEASGSSVPEELSITDCLIKMDADGYGIQIQGGVTVAIDTTTIVSPGGATRYIDLQLVADLQLIALRDNTFVGGTTVPPIRVTPVTNEFKILFMTGNRVEGDATQVAIDFVAPGVGGSYTRNPYISENDIVADELMTITAMQRFPADSYLAGGNGRCRFDGTQYAGMIRIVANNPEGTLPGYIGDMCFQVNLGLSSDVWHVKESNDGGTTGWGNK